MHDDLAWLGVRGRHLLTPLHRLPLGVVQLLPRLADPQAQSNLRTKLRRQSRFRPLGTISVRFPVGPALLPISVEVQQGLPMGPVFLFSGKCRQTKRRRCVGERLPDSAIRPKGSA